MAPKSVTFRRHDHLVSVLFEDLLSHSYNITFSMFLDLVNIGSLFLVGPSSTEPEQDSCSFQVCCTLIYPTVPSSTRADTVVANATTKK